MLKPIAAIGLWLIFWAVALIAAIRYRQDKTLLGEASYRVAFKASRNLLACGRWPLTQIPKERFDELVSEWSSEVKVARRGC